MEALGMPGPSTTSAPLNAPAGQISADAADQLLAAWDQLVKPAVSFLAAMLHARLLDGTTAGKKAFCLGTLNGTRRMIQAAPYCNGAGR